MKLLLYIYGLSMAFAQVNLGEYGLVVEADGRPHVHRYNHYQNGFVDPAIATDEDGRTRPASEMGRPLVAVATEPRFLVIDHPAVSRSEAARREILLITAELKDPASGETMALEIAEEKRRTVVMAEPSQRIVPGQDIGNFIHRSGPWVIDVTWSSFESLMTNRQSTNLATLNEVVRGLSERPLDAETERKMLILDQLTDLSENPAHKELGKTIRAIPDVESALREGRVRPVR